MFLNPLVTGWSGGGAAIETLAEEKTPAASVWTKIVTAGVNRVSNGLSKLESHLFVSEDDEDDEDDAFQTGLSGMAQFDSEKKAGTLEKIKEAVAGNRNGMML